MTKGTDQESGKNNQRSKGTDPWLSQRTGIIIIIVGSLALAVFITWQLVPPFPVWEAVLWGLGFALAMWAVFGLAVAFNRWVRGR